MGNKILQAYGVGGPIIPVFPQPVIALRDPTSNDTNYPLCQVWENKNTRGIFIFNGAAWISVSSGSISGLTTNALVYATSSTTIATLAAATNGQLPIGNTGNPPTLATITAGSGITVTNGAGSITIAATGGGISGLTTNGAVYAASATTIASTAALTNGQLLVGSTGVAPVAATITAGQNITVTNGAGSISVGASQTLLVSNYTNVTTTPYVVTGTDYFLSVDSSSLAITIQLPNAPTTRRSFVIKDRTGNAAANPISVTTVGGVVTIDGATTYTLNQDFESIELMFNGTSYEVY